MFMKKGLLISLLGVCLSFAQLTGYAQQNQYNKGSIVINPGLGLGYYYGGGFAVGFSVNAEFSITDEIAIGPYFAYTRWDYNYSLGADYHYTFLDFGARASYHFAKLLKINEDRFDPYAGAFVGFVSSSFESDFAYVNDPYDGSVRGGAYAGARWYFSDAFAAFGEVGIGLYPVLLGVTLRIN
jgi:hypothetical protein